MKNRRFSLFLLSLLFVLCVTGCGKDKKLTEYEEKMSDFFSNISELNDNMNAIDTTDPVAAQKELLTYLDALEDEFNSLASLEVPKEFASVESLADEAAENMTNAVATYHQVFESDSYDAALADVADEYYSRANIRLQYIISILHGELPEGDNVTITTENDTPDESVENPVEQPQENVIETHGVIETENPLED